MTDSQKSPSQPGRPKYSDNILSGNLRQAVLGIAFPTWGAFITHDLMGTVDMLFVGRLGAASIAAVAISGALMGLIFMLSQGVTAGTTALVANAVGRGDQNEAERVTGQSIIMTFIISCAVAMFGAILAEPALRLMGADETIIEAGVWYLRLTMIGALVMMPSMACGAALRGAGDARTPFWAILIGNIANVILDPILIFGLLWMPQLGVAGSAVATVIGRFVGAVVMLQAFTGKSPTIRVESHALVPDFPLMIRIARIGVFAMFRMLARNIAGIVFIRLVTEFGTAATAAYGIGMRLRLFVMGPSMGFGTAAATLIGQNLGAGNEKRARQSGWMSLGICSGFVMLITVIFWVFGHQILGLFTDDPQVVAEGAGFVRWFVSSFVFMSIGMVLGNAMTGAGDAFVPMVISSAALFLVAIPGVWWISAAWQNAEGIWAGLALANLAEALLFIMAFRMGRWVTAGLKLRNANAAAQ